MIFFSTINSNKTDLLVECFFKLRNKGIEPEKILTLVQNGRKKKIFTEKIKKLSPYGNIGSLNVYSFFGLARSFIEKNWPVAQNIIKDPNSRVFANLCGLEVSQYIFKNCIKEVEFKGYNSKVNLLHQLLRRYSLIVQNALCEDEIKLRERILKESFAKDVREAIKLYKLETLNLRAFDYLRQVSIFEYLYKNVPNPYKYVILDDADEITPACFEYLKYIKDDTDEFFIAQDPLGSSRLGYLSSAVIDYEKFLNEKAIDLRENNQKNQNAQMLFDSIKSKTPVNIQNIGIKSFIRRDELINTVADEIKELIKNGARPNEIAIVTPVCDDFLRHCFKKIKQEVFFLSGSEKLNQNAAVGAIVEILKLINSPDAYLSPFILKGILLEILNMDSDEAINLTQRYREANYEYKKNIIEFLKESNEPVIQEFLTLLDSKNASLSTQLYQICSRYIKPVKENQNTILKLNKLAKQISDFEEVFCENFKKEKLIEQLENTIISENPLSEDEIPQSAIVAATPQKLIDSEIAAKYLFLIDCSDSDWIKQDIGMLYNSWVFQKSWSKDSFELSDNLELTQDRTARILYKLYLLADKMLVYSSIYNTLGQENFGAIDKFFEVTNICAAPKKIIPRDDQKPVLDYKWGKMAVSAVAGSGKTTIMLALILKLLDGEIIKGLKSENIFVLTFMESAARNFRERIKQNYPDMVEMPQISTIHGLSLRILKENNNYTFIGLDDNFEIIDENKRREILARIIVNSGLDYDKTDLYERAVSDFKNEKNYPIHAVKSPTFKRIFSGYEREMKENNFVDYDDLLIYALRLLETNSSVRGYYQNLARVIIEDEAQDSSPIQQELIEILGAKHGNIIRCGDVNQAITATFSNSDVAGFKKFIKDNLNVEMNKSQRCGIKIIDFANKTVEYASLKAPDAFLNINMKPVEGKNPSNPDAVTLKVFDNGLDEKKYIVNEIKNIRQIIPDASIGVLLRSNWAISSFADFMENHNIKTAKNFDLLSNNPVYKTVLAIFNFINDPKDKKKVLKSLETLLENEKYYREKDITNFASENDFLDTLGAKYSLWWDLKYFLFKNSITPMELVLEIADFYFKDTLQMANAAMVYSIVDKLYAAQKTFENTVCRMNEIANRLNKNAKFFTDDNDTKNSGAVRIMTLHKAKGDEFDYVFIPELTTDNLGLQIEDIKLKKNTEFIQSVKSNPKSENVLKQEILEENFRLLYVGITRAKIKLYLTCAKSYKMYKNDKKAVPCAVFDELKEQK